MNDTPACARETLLTGLHAAVELCAEPFLEQVRIRFVELDQRLREQRFHLAVLGQFKRGKSSLLNALLGANVLPVGVVPVTSVPTFIEHNASPSLRVEYENGANETLEIKELSAFVTEKENPHNRRAVKRVVIRTPCPMLDNGVVLIDTPGIGSTHIHNTETTLNVLPHCDAAIFVVSTDPPITEAELDFLRHACSLIDRFFVVLNKIDLLNADDRLESQQFLSDVLHTKTAVKDNTVWALSTRNHREGVAELTRALRAFIEHDRLPVLCRSIESRARTAVQDAGYLCRLQLRALELPAERLRHAIESMEKLTGSVNEERRRIQDQLDGERRRFERRSREDVRRMAQECHATIVDALQIHSAPVNETDLAASLQDTVDGLMRGYFERTSERYFDDRTRELDAATAVHIQRAHELLAHLAEQTAAILHLPPRTPEPLSVVTERPRFFWVTERHPTRTLAEAAATRLTALVSPTRQRQRIIQTLQKESLDLCTRNANVIRNAMSDRVDRTLRAITAQLDKTLATALDDTQRALAAALAEKSRQIDTVEPHRQRIAALMADLASVEAQLS